MRPEAPAGPPWLVGWKEYVDLPDWGVWRVRTKVDTGARTSALDVASYDLAEEPGRGLVATLRLALSRKHPGRLKEIRVPVVKIVTVINSSGMREQRPLVETTAWLGPCRKRIRLTITNRAGMRFRMILGREALATDLVVDVSKKYLLSTRRK